MAEFRMPWLGADMDRGTLVEWRVHPGDRVARGDIVALVETEKGLVEVEIFAGGVVESLIVEPGTTVPVGTVLAMIHDDAESAAVPSAAPPVATAPPPPPPAPTAPPAAPPVSPPIPTPKTPAPHVRVSPLAKRTAAELQVDLATVRGTGEAGAITRADVERAAVAPAAVAGPPDRLASMRKVIAAAMSRSKREIPHYYLATQIDMGRVVSWLAAENAGRPVSGRLLPAAVLLRAVALAVREVPEMNGFWTDGQFRPGVGIHIGVAISLRQGGLVAPALHDVDQKNLEQLMRELLDLVKRTRAGVLRSSEIADATITVTNLGDQGVETVFGVIYPPQVALVGFGHIVERPWTIADGAVATRPLITASLAADHRASDGHRGGRFLATIGRLLQTPEAL